MNWKQDPRTGHAQRFMTDLLEMWIGPAYEAHDTDKLREWRTKWDEPFRRGDVSREGVPSDVIERTEQIMTDFFLAATGGAPKLARARFSEVGDLWRPLPRFKPPFHQRTIVDGEDRPWGVHSTSSFAAGAFGVPPDPPSERYMLFLSEKGTVRRVPIEMDDPGARDATDAELLELLGRAE